VRIRVVIRAVLDLETELVKHHLPASSLMSNQFGEDM